MKIKPTKYKLNTGSLKQKQSGFSLIELLVASLIGIFIVAGIITNFVGTKDSEKVRSAISEMDSNARVAMEILRVTIGHASYGGIDGQKGIQAFHAQTTETLVDSDCKGGVEKVLGGRLPSDILMSKDGAEADKKTDQITTVYLADNPCADGATECIVGGPNAALISPAGNDLVYYDCTGGGATKNKRSVLCSADSVNGMTNTRDAKIYSSFFIRKQSNKSGLYCTGSRTKGQPLELIEDVENMQVRYGVLVGAGNTATTRYLTATEINAGIASWGNVNSVQIALLMRSSGKHVLKGSKQVAESDSISSNATTVNYNLLGTTIKINNKDGRLYRVYSTTIKIVNRDVEPIF